MGLFPSAGAISIYKFYNCNFSKNKIYKIKSPLSLWYTNWSHLNCLLEVYSDLYFFLWPKIKIHKYESQKSENLFTLLMQRARTFTFTYFNLHFEYSIYVYPGWDLTLAMSRAWVWYDLIYTDCLFCREHRRIFCHKIGAQAFPKLHLA